ncbi:MAG: Gfo/Idh/MocA family oxidoreductase [Bacteroidetes bacterium]|nr:Gfo/Idh/MocA family oxidoreductase [Bacteroidota bacterium]
MINTAIIGFGLSGKVFHAPFVKNHENFTLKTIVTTKPELPAPYHDIPISRDFRDVLDDPSIDLVVISTPNEFHKEQTIQTLQAGKHVVLEKPITPTFKDAEEIIKVAGECRRLLFPYQNRRWDGDFLTVKKILEQNLLGDILEFESHFDRYNPEVGRASWRYTKKMAGGTLFDLGVHLIDQSISLFGKPDAVFCRLFNQRENSIVDDSFDLKLIYPRKNVTIKAGVFVREKGPRFTIHGRKGSFVKYGLDPQEKALVEGKMPGGELWGVEGKEDWGTIHTEMNGKVVRKPFETLAGNYMGFYANVAEVIEKGAEMAVKPSEAALNIRIIENAIQSNENQSVMPL